MLKMGSFYRQNSIYFAKQAIERESILGFLQNVSVLGKYHWVFTERSGFNPLNFSSG
jgi:hypothetical protein